MASGARVFHGCRSLFAAAKSATQKSPATAATTTACAKTTTTVKNSTEKPAKKSKSGKPVAINKQTRISHELSAFLGVQESSRTDALKKIWEYAKLHDLQDPEDKRDILCDEKLEMLLGSRSRVNFLEIPKLLAPHFSKTAVSLLAAAKSATPSPTATAATTTTAAKKRTTVKKSTEDPRKQRKWKPVPINQPTRVTNALSRFLGVREISRTQAVKKIWEYIKLHNLQDPKDKRTIMVDDNLGWLLGCTSRINFLEIPKYLAPHFDQRMIYGFY